ncbi:hypothetical protein CYLTODRAFT_494002 [Cylindrobasidium torrendii FP15055 ss-10]|uniref:Uncharacterized protein n=1 Tax=Cylindrobasidium torrendii FP15055 ss-10 TaxID=1314674 RepID=A0A0D7AZD2_9AGAR|nr:hypothetical protein CYLTODRAFT_494002 [Cylindrobasidium torrendii FP15055 ss-10]
MNSSLPLECFSLSRDFSSPVVELRYLNPSNSDDRLLDRLEYFNGMNRGDSENYLSSELNTIKCRKDIAALLTSAVRAAPLFLFPKKTKAVVQRLQRLATRNSEAKLEKRTMFEKKFPRGVYEYRFVYLDFKQAIYVRNPVTGEITEHNAPYTCMPKVMSTLNPCFWAAQTATTYVATTAMHYRGSNRVLSSFRLGTTYENRIPLDFFYHGGRALGDFPRRHLPYTPQELGVPELPTSRKRARSEVDSDDWTAVSVDLPYCDLPGITSWRDSATDTHSSGSRTLVDVETAPPPYGDKEPASVHAQDGGCGDQWLLVLEQRAAEAADKVVRKTYTKLISDIDRARSRPVPPAKPCKTKTTQRPLLIRPVKVRRLY